LVPRDNGMVARSLTATQSGIQQINRVLTDLGWSREDLAKECDCSRQPAIKFCSGKPVSKKLFVSFCNALELNWETVAGQKADVVVEPSPNATPDIANLVKAIRAQVYDDIKTRCGTMRVLDMEQPIGLGDIYTSVNILEKISGRRRLGLEDLLQDCDPENFDRFLLGQVRHKRIPGLQAVEEHRQLMILGKPGAGKTTFMKRLAILCNEGEFQPQRVPVFVTLKEYAEAEGKPKLKTFIQNQWKACEVKEPNALEAILKAGQALVLLDGLDEVQENDHDRVLQDIKTFTQQFRDCQCVITCRIAAREYIFETFTEVEVADFDPKQIAEFSMKWFKAKQELKKAESFIEKLKDKDNEPIRELAVTPILLTLLCLIFEATSEFPKNRSDFYQQGVDWLLRKWDNRRGVKRDMTYKRLSLSRKKELLNQFAFATFEQGNYFFKQTTVEQHIINYIHNLPGASEDEEALQLDSEAILKSIEAQHGLLVERARGIYSFSHLTFQEYFTAQYIVSSTDVLNQTLQNLVAHIAEKCYREIFLLTAGMLPEADPLLLRMKFYIDQIIQCDYTEESRIDLFLIWIYQKTNSMKMTCKLSSARAVYLARGRDIDLARDIDYDVASDCDLAHDHYLGQYITEAIRIAVELIYSEESEGSLLFELDKSESLTWHKNPELKLKIQALRRSLPVHYRKDDKWWRKHGNDWVDQLRKAVLCHCNIGHDWRFSETQEEKLKQYYEANKLLVDCLNSDCYVTKATRQYIEDTLLLPLSEIEKYPVPDAIANL
jgi:predicted NACHT family NTPase